MTAALPSARIGRTELHVSRLGLGTAPLIGKNGSIPEAQSVATILAALTADVTLFDTAPLYGAGCSKQRLGIALQGVPRDSYVLSTKVGRLVLADGKVVYDFSRDGVLRSFEQSLERLKLDRIDLLLVHDPDDNEHQVLEQASPALVELRTQGRIGAIGAGMNQWQMLDRFAQNFDVDCFLLDGRYTRIEQTALEFLARCQERGIGIFLGASTTAASWPWARGQAQHTTMLRRCPRSWSMCSRSRRPACATMCRCIVRQRSSLWRTPLSPPYC